MAVKTHVSEEEYLRTAFDGVDQEYDDGELIERGMPDEPHSKTQTGASGYFHILRKLEHLPFFSRTELRVRLRPRRYVVPDVAVWWPAPPAERVPSTPPLIVIEILSTDDRMSQVLGKLQEYVDWGVPHVWFIDPYTRKLATYDRGGLHYVSEFAVPETNRAFTPADLFD